ncbi:hypothetical protein N7539_000422 [Penicillium diatomitis]|uniref:Uncharacterized protein n=1 Tax=Penicillium diatomitis TaxID=2819901 RepID=A0A9W9XLM4_9EURO|nr:uncharacterized protein N7539_000422 [Penicillium diatomitis]KAJ5495306.1 hypothetical protein N7539_000422 [Penicillium diatomitis]
MTSDLLSRFRKAFGSSTELVRKQRPRLDHPDQMAPRTKTAEAMRFPYAHYALLPCPDDEALEMGGT